MKESPPSRTEWNEKIKVGNIETPASRRETVEKVLKGLKRAFDLLEVPYPVLPKVKLDFRGQGKGEVTMLGQTEVTADGIAIPFDERLLDPGSEKKVIEDLLRKGREYPGLGRVLAHELGHISLWSVTGSERSPSSTRLLDEGWASLVEQAAVTKTKTVEKLAERVRKEAKETLEKDPKACAMFLDFSAQPASGERVPGSNAAEYALGPAFLLWIRGIAGKEAMAELLKNTQAAGLMGPEDEPNSGFREYASREGEEVSLENARKWEKENFEAALLKATGYGDLGEVKERFLDWLRQD